MILIVFVGVVFSLRQHDSLESRDIQLFSIAAFNSFFICSDKCLPTASVAYIVPTGQNAVTIVEFRQNFQILVVK